ncbi:phosphotransferase [Candidatus Vidania fulgoroideorum]
MASYIKLKKKKICIKIKKIFNIKIKKIKEIKCGTENSNYLLISNKKYILTIFKKNTKKKFLKENILLLNFLYMKNIPCPKVLDNKIFKYENNSCLILKFLKGRSVNKCSNKKSFYLGKLLKKIHNSSFSFFVRKKNKFNIEYLLKKCNIKGIFNIKNINFNNIFINHGDIFMDNVFYKKNKIIGIFDFYFFCCENNFYDISIIVNEWFFKNKIKKKRIKYFLKGYNIKYINNTIFYIYLLVSAIRFFLSRFLNKKKNPFFYLKKIIILKNEKFYI